MTFGACEGGGGSSGGGGGGREGKTGGRKLDEIEPLSDFMNISHITRRMLGTYQSRL